MKNVFFILAAVAALDALTAFAVDGDLAVPAVGLVHFDRNNPDTYYGYLAAYPVFNYEENGVFVRNPLLADNGAAAGDGANAGRLWVVGGAAQDKVNAVAAVYNVPAGKVNPVEGGVCEMAATLSANWTAARTVVVAPYVPAGDEQAEKSATFAAALAAVLNAPVLFTYTARVPAETNTALRQLGASRIIVVDFGGKVGPDVLSSLGRGRTVPQVITTAADANSLINHTLRVEGRKVAPATA